MPKHYVLKHATRNNCVDSKSSTFPSDPGYKKHKEFDTEVEAKKWIDDNCDEDTTC